MKFTVCKKVEVVEEVEIEYGEAEDLEAHYVSLNRWHWYDASTEAVNIYNTMLGLEYDEDSEYVSLAHDVFHAACFAASEGVFEAIAACLGVTNDDVYEVVGHWYEKQDEARAPIGFDEFVARVKQQCEERVKHA